MKFEDNIKNVRELLDIVNEYRDVNEKYDSLTRELELLESNIKDIELEKKACEIQLEENRNHEKQFLERLKDSDPEAYKDLTENIKEYIK